MACACAANRSSTVLHPAAELPHEVLPSESCIFCADKHVSTAYAELLSSGFISTVIGELELARRHTLLEYGSIAAGISRIEYETLLRHDASSLYADVMDGIRSIADATDPDKRTESGPARQLGTYGDAVNPFIGELHICAAYRLASEVGYMSHNRNMVIGDLATAREQLTRFDHGIDTVTRELRHRIQTVKASDLNIYWPYIVGQISNMVTSNIAEYADIYGDGLKKYLKL